MITASHNPGRYNGIKYKGHFGGSIGKEVTDYIESRLYKSGIKFIDKETAVSRGLLKTENIIRIHLDAVRKYVDMRLLKKAGLKVLVDSMNGTGVRYIEEILKNTTNKVTTINSERDPYFGGRPPEPNEVHLKSTSEAVKKGKFDVALATDGDADRLGVILPDGTILSGHKVMTLLFLHLLEDRHLKGDVVQTICGTALIEKICKLHRIKIHETPVGFKYISDVIGKENILVGGEETGGVALKGWLPERDGIVSGLLILEMLAARKKSLAKIVEDINRKYGIYVYKRYDLKYTAKKQKKLLETLRKKPFKKVLGKAVTEVKSFDGYRFILSDGSWVMFRSSGTEPKLRMYSEGHSEKEANALIAFGRKFAQTV